MIDEEYLDYVSSHSEEGSSEKDAISFKNNGIVPTEDNDYPTFINHIDEYHQMDFDENLYEELESGKYISRINYAILSELKSYVGASALEAASTKLSKFISLLSDFRMLDYDLFKIDQNIDDSIVIRFHGHKDIKLNLYFDKDSQDYDSDEEAYLSYKKGSVRIVTNGSIPYIVDILKGIL